MSTTGQVLIVIPVLVLAMFGQWKLVGYAFNRGYEMGHADATPLRSEDSPFYLDHGQGNEISDAIAGLHANWLAGLEPLATIHNATWAALIRRHTYTDDEGSPECSCDLWLDGPEAHAAHLAALVEGETA